MGKLFGLLGERLEHSFSPRIHSMIMEKLGIQGCYHLFEVAKEDIEDAICGLKVLGVGGVNVTIPHKVEVMKYLHGISKEAEQIGAVNTIFIEGERATGYNTDYFGLERMFGHYHIPVKNQRAVILGTGGAAKAVIQYLKDHRIKDITMVSRYPQRAREAYQDFQVLSYGEISKEGRMDLLINCTPLGMQPLGHESPVGKEVVEKTQWAIELNYNPACSRFLKYAREAEVQGINGLYMLVGQAVKSQEIWHQTEISEEVLLAIYNILTQEAVSKN